ncbi:hypothetical protein Tsedi_00947 [Tepidimonas sediminis]|uniref:Integral membrane protein n=1 Tax=Tepidimonas sediminis TaxID=2588941 RepID=A0A554WRE1_9BURK|nr:DUF2244 domain-containing protein [Tepidimonas sediminis]TSE26134.1 hypothetical protein Tsedi_00947 [Tepidimonas sediminis]
MPPALRLAQAMPGGWRWQLRRNGALTPRQFVAAFALACGALLAVALMFASLGATLVLPFAALELGVVVLAFAWMARHAADREELELDAALLHVRRWEAGKAAAVQLPRPWVRVESPGHARDLVRLRAVGRIVEVGRHVRPEVRQQLAHELRWALAQPAPPGSG